MVGDFFDNLGGRRKFNAGFWKRTFAKHTRRMPSVCCVAHIGCKFGHLECTHAFVHAQVKRGLTMYVVFVWRNSVRGRVAHSGSV